MATLNYPNIFSNATTADGDEVEANFQAVSAVVNNNIGDANVPVAGLSADRIAGTAATTDSGADTVYTDTVVTGGGMAFNRTAVADANYVFQTGDQLIVFPALTANRTVTFPLAASVPAGYTIILKNESSGAFNILLDPAGADQSEVAGTKDAATKAAALGAFAKAGYYSDGVSAWYEWVR